MNDVQMYRLHHILEYTAVHSFEYIDYSGLTIGNVNISHLYCLKVLIWCCCGVTNQITMIPNFNMTHCDRSTCPNIA